MFGEWACVGSVVWGVPGSRLCGERGCVGSVCCVESEFSAVWQVG